MWCLKAPTREAVIGAAASGDTRRPAFDAITRYEYLRSAARAAAGLLLAACAPWQSGGQSEAGTRPATLEYWCPSMGPEQTAVQEQVHRELEQKHPHLTVQLVQISGGWDAVTDKLAISVSGNVQPNATRLPDNILRLLIFQGQLTPLDSFIKRDRFDVSGLDKGMRARGTVDGKLYILPWSGGMLALYYNQDLFEKAGVPLPETTKPLSWDRFVDAAVRVRRLGEDVWGFRVGGDLDKPNWSTVKEWLPWLWSNGNDYFDRSETKPLFGDAKGVASVQLLTDLMQKYRAAPAPGQSRPGGTSGKVGMWVSQSGNIVSMRRDAPTVRYGCSVIPVGPGGRTSYGVQGGSFIAIPHGAKDQDATWLYLRWVTTEENNLRLMIPAFQDPVWASGRLKPPFSEVPQYKAFVEQYKTARARPGNPVYRLTEESTAEELQAAYRGAKSPPDAVKAAVAKAIAIIQQNTKK